MASIAHAVVPAAATAGLLSGIPSTVHALATGRSPLDSVRAAGTLVVADDASATRRFVAGLAVHAFITLGWTSVLALMLPRRHRTLWGALAGVAIAVLDLRIAAQRYPAIAALPRAAQVADHITFGAVVGFVLGSVRRRGATGSAAGSGSG